MTHTTKTQLAKEKKYYDESFENGPPYYCGGAYWNCANDHALYDENPELEEFILNQE
jgi:hypothetical protein